MDWKMLNDYGKSLFKPWFSVQNVVVGMAGLFLAVLAIRTGALTQNELASWVQAIGSIAAIWGAFRVGSLAHAREVERRTHEAAESRVQVKTMLSRLSQAVWFDLTALRTALEGSLRDPRKASLVQYLALGHGDKWPHMIEVLRGVDVRDINGFETLLLMDLKIACSFAIKACENLISWDQSTPDGSMLLSRACYHEGRAEQAFKKLDSTISEKKER